MKLVNLSFFFLLLSTSEAINGKPNFIIMQPDDLEFLEAWTPPAHFTDSAELVINRPSNASMIPHLEYLRTNGLQMRQAHAASPMCGTSRYSTITGRYPSRSARGRQDDSASDIRDVVIPNTKLMDERTVADPLDCSLNNIAQAFKSDMTNNPYRTGVVGKWHLYSGGRNEGYNYESIQDEIRSCGFDFAEAIYIENLNSAWTQTYTHDIDHNMEHVAAEAINFIQDSIVQHQQPFFLYLNPTVPHGGGDVEGVLKNGDCRHTVAGVLSDAPQIPDGAPESYSGDCSAYRQTVLDRGTIVDTRRGEPVYDDKELGMIWIDDSVGWVIDTLYRLGELDNTFFLFQQDHGQEGKSTLYEQGVRMAQFVHYPAEFTPGEFNGITSTIDLGPTMLDIAGINTDLYEMDGESWYPATQDPSVEDQWKQRCTFFEQETDRAVKCGCDVYMQLSESSSTTRVTAGLYGITLNAAEGQLFNICSSDNMAEPFEWITSPAANPQQDGASLMNSSPETAQAMSDLIACHLTRTDPQIDPDYVTICDLADDSSTTTTSTLSSSTTSTTTTVSCVDQTDIFIRGTARTCEWISRRGRCSGFETECPFTCGGCTP